VLENQPPESSHKSDINASRRYERAAERQDDLFHGCAKEVRAYKNDASAIAAPTTEHGLLPVASVNVHLMHDVSQAGEAAEEQADKRAQGNACA
jgi:hypothetical protein